MWSRKVMLPLIVLIGAGVVDGAVLGGTRFLGWSLSAWPVIGGLAALVIVALSDQMHATAHSEGSADDPLSTVDKQNALIASGMVIAGLAVLLQTFAPRGGPGFAAWAGIAAVAMGFMLGIFKSILGERRIDREPWWERPGEQAQARHQPT